MKKMCFGIMLSVMGFLYSSFCFFYAAMHPWEYNGIGGMLGSFLGTHTLYPFIISLAVMVVGVCISGYEAYRKK